jgi:hypothetical protein
MVKKPKSDDVANIVVSFGARLKVRDSSCSPLVLECWLLFLSLFSLKLLFTVDC